MTTIAVTGHMDLTDDSVPLVRAALGELLSAYPPAELVGVSCVAAGSDTLFAVGILVALMVSCLLAVGAAWGAYWYLDAAGPGGPFAGS